MKSMRLIFMLVLFSMFSFLTEAALITNYPTTVTQPDGTDLNCYISGDEFYRRYHDSDDYTIIQDSETARWVYAIEKNGQLSATDYVFGESNPKELGLKKRAMIDPELIRAERMEHFRQTRKPNFNKNEKTQVNNTGTIHNVVIYIRFNDDTEYSDDTSTYHNMFNGSSGNSMYSYFDEVSYNSLSIYSHFYPRPSNNIVKSYQDTANRGFYQPYDANLNPIGYQNNTQKRLREHTLLKVAIENVRSEIPSNLDIDNDNDGYVDNVTFVVKGSTGNWSDLLWPHMWSLWSYTVTINGSRVWGYNFHLQNFLKSYGNGVLSHEMFHTLGAPDLYHYNQDNLQPVGSWDLMGNTTNPPQHMGAWMKYQYGGWISSIPSITSDGSYSLNPITSSSGNCYRINSPNSTSQWFLVEYRKSNSSFESQIPGDGLLVYRITPDSVPNGNMNGPPDEVYVYRPNGGLNQRGTPASAYFSSQAGRTKIDSSTNPNPFLADGSKGGLIISNIGSAGNTISFTVGTGINPPNLISPSDNAGSVGLGDTLIWSTVSSASTYDLQVSTWSNFQTYVVNQTGINDTVYVPSANWNYGTTYYWRVRSVGSSTSNWSTAKSFTIKLQTPTLTIPNDGNYGFPLTGNLQWGIVQGATSYNIEISENSNFTTTVHQGSTTVEDYQIPQGVLENNTLYYWRVKAISSSPSTESDWSNPWSFTSILAKPELVMPPHDSLGYDIEGYFVWKQVAGATGYKLQVSDNVNFTGFEINESSLTDTSYNFAGLSYDTDYYWKVQAFNTNQEGEWSDIYTFQTNLRSPSLVYPSNNAKQVSVNPTLLWNNVSSGDKFDVEVATDTNMANIVFDPQDISGDTNFTCTDLGSMTKYFWRVRSKNDDGRISKWSGVYSFTTTLSTPLIPDPADSAENVAISGDLVWDEIVGAQRYHIQLSSNESFTNIVLNDSNVVGESVYFEDLSPDTKYYWRVRAISGTVKGDWSDTWEFTTSVGKVTLTAPVNGAVSIPTDGDVTWNAMPGSESYDLMLSSEPDFSTSEYDETGLTSAQFTYSDLETNTMYYWKVRAVTGGQAADWSVTWHFTTSAGEPTLVTPDNDEGGMGLSDTLKWLEDPMATSYQIQIASDENFNSKIYDEPNITNTFYVYNGFTHFTNYYWRVRSNNANGNSPWSETRMFTTLIDTPSLFAPDNDSYHVDINVTLDWDAVSGAESYQLIVSDKSDFSNEIYNNDEIMDTEISLDVLQNNTKYYWKVRANNSDRNSGYSEEWHFTTALACPTLNTPSDESENLKYEGQLTWNPIGGADSYRIQLAKDENFNDIVVDSSGILFSFYNYSGLDALTDYYWRVGSKNENGTCEWSEIWKFKTKDPTDVADMDLSGINISIMPNPFTEFTRINIESSDYVKAQIGIYDIYGRLIKDFRDKYLSEGQNSVVWNAANENSGVYQVKISIQGNVYSKKIVLIR